MSAKLSVEARVTATILEALEKGVRPWQQPWAGSTGPLRITGEAYRGINVLLLTISSAAGEFRSPTWMTYLQAEKLGGQVRRGQRGTYIVKYGQSPVADDQNEGASAETETRYRGWLRGYSVFNVDQIDGLPEEFYAPSAIDSDCPTPIWDDEIERTLAATGADISWTGESAYYAPAHDHIRMPDRERFLDAETAYSTLCHELVHWTGAKHRLARDFSRKTEAYAREELVAELGAAFLGGRLGFRPDHIQDHAAYLDHWIRVLRSDSRAIIAAASKAQEASDYILDLIASAGQERALAA